MNPAKQKLFRFSDLDEFAFAAVRKRFDEARLSTEYVVSELGPLMELLHLSEGGRMPYPGSWLAFHRTTSFVGALRQKRQVWYARKMHAGFIRAVRFGADGEDQFTSFLMAAQRAARDIAQLPAQTSGQLVAAMRELENNIHEHAVRSQTGLVAYQAKPGVFEFVVADRGIGILDSLRRCEAYAHLPDHGKALEAALTDGISRHGPDSRRGHGFRPIFIGLLNLYGELRFRSGDHAITMEGTSLDLATARVSQKPPIDGFLASVRSHRSRKMKDIEMSNDPI